MTNLVSVVPKVSRLIRNLALDLRYGSFLGGTVKTPYADLGIHDSASTDYGALPHIFENAISPSDVLVDIGCGKGRVINWWLSRGYINRMVGLEIDPEVARQTSERLSKWHNVQIISGDALVNLPQDGTIFYLFNPFNEQWVQRFKANVDDFKSKRAIRIFYYNCLHCHLFEADRSWAVERISLHQPFHPLAIVRPAPDTKHEGPVGR
jgi:Methyltransferase domain